MLRLLRYNSYSFLSVKKIHERLSFRIEMTFLTPQFHDVSKTRIVELKAALRLGDSPRLAFVGAGGKTTALFRIAREFTSPVIATATARMESWQIGLADNFFCCLESQPCSLPALPGVTLFAGEQGNHSVAGLGPIWLQKTLELAYKQNMPMLIEADGARRHPLKAPAEHEPPIPNFVDTVVVTAGLSSLGNDISADWVHRPEIFASLSEELPGSPISAKSLCRVLCHPSGGLKNIPAGARRIVLLNQANTQELYDHARSIVPTLLCSYHAVVISALREKRSTENTIASFFESQSKLYSAYESVAGVIISTWRSSSSLSSTLTWMGEPLIRQVAQAALEAGLSPLILVTDFYDDHIFSALEGIPIHIINVPSKQVAYPSLLRVGLEAIPFHINAAILLSAQQPPTSPIQLLALTDAYARTHAQFITMQDVEESSTPALVDREIFSDLLDLNKVGSYPQINFCA
jgi:molybdenum cofactor cytidylyltransferase